AQIQANVESSARPGKVVQNNCKTTHPELSKLSQGVLSLDARTTGQQEIFPDLPLLIQQALRSSHITQSSGNEIEAMLHIASHFEATKNLNQAVQMATSTRPPCMPYMQAVPNFVQKYSGGPTFPVVKLLAHVRRSFQTSLMLGQDFTEAVSNMDFKEPSSTFPWLRANLASPSSKDNIGRSISKPDFEKLKQPNLRTTVLQAERQLQGNYELVVARNDNDTNLGRACQAAATEPAVPAKLEDTMDAAKICLQRTAMQFDQYYKVKGDSKLWKFVVELDHEKAHFHHKPLFASKEEVVSVAHEDLKQFKLAPGEPPRLVPTEDTQPLLPQNSASTDMEVAKAKATLVLSQTYTKCFG
ncbi:unnamed protein product, partial [Symbiodinium sp. KB8]